LTARGKKTTFFGRCFGPGPEKKKKKEGSNPLCTRSGGKKGYLLAIIRKGLGRKGIIKKKGERKGQAAISFTDKPLKIIG